MKIQPYIDRVLGITKRIYPKEYPQIDAFVKTYQAQLPKTLTEAQINRALKLAEVIQRNLEQMKEDILDEEEELRDMGIEETG
ncbi:hypothetical protein M0R72_06145 [Candidatus Pacearchaeota archaeon]|jgi:hypothetical protein|nr:hypothetical protein [Candidatus Pacearchaeota archaeon]